MKYDPNNITLSVNGEELLGCSTSHMMEKWIKGFNHLIGCEFVGCPKGKYIVEVECSYVFREPASFLVLSNKGYSCSLDSVKFYLDNGALVNYEGYMTAYYPEYEHIWRDQL